MKRAILFFLLSLSLSLSLTFPAQADEPMIGEIRMWSSTLYIPPGWKMADGTNMNETLYPDLCYRLGSTYGSAPSGYCKLPNLSGRNAIGYNSSQPAFDSIGETGGEQTHTLTVSEIPAHDHNIGTTSLAVAAGGTWARLGGSSLYPTTSNGGDQAHNVLDPYLTVYYIIYVGGAASLTPTPTLIATNTPGPTPTDTPTPTVTPTGTLTPTVTPAATTCASPFPSTGILDDFNRADESPATGWTDLVNGVQVVSSELASNGDYSSWSVWSTPVGPDAEVYFTLTTLPGDNSGMSVVARSDMSSAYNLNIVRDTGYGDYLELHRSFGILLDSYTLSNLQAGDRFGLRVNGSAIDVFYSPVGSGDFTPVISISDTAITSGDYIGVLIWDGTARIDDFGGGTYVPGSCNNTYLPYVITTTLQSGNTLSVPEQVSFGQIITSGIVISLLALFALDFIFRFVYRR